MLDYLADEVLDGQPGQVRAFCLETSVLERLSGELCDAVTGRSGGQAMLHDIEQAGLFLVPLDEVRGWWRYHHLFADLLRARLEQDQPGRVLAATGPQPPGSMSMIWATMRSGTRWRPGTRPGRPSWSSGTSMSCSAAARA